MIFDHNHLKFLLLLTEVGAGTAGKITIEVAWLRVNCSRVEVAIYCANDGDEVISAPFMEEGQIIISSRCLHFYQRRRILVLYRGKVDGGAARMVISRLFDDL